MLYVAIITIRIGLTYVICGNYYHKNRLDVCYMWELLP